MGHLLKSVNPEAAARIENGPQPPDVGTMVVYMARAGMQRMGRREFPAIVLAADSDGYLDKAKECIDTTFFITPLNLN